SEVQCPEGVLLFRRHVDGGCECVAFCFSDLVNRKRMCLKAILLPWSLAINPGTLQHVHRCLGLKKLKCDHAIEYGADILVILPAHIELLVPVNKKIPRILECGLLSC